MPKALLIINPIAGTSRKKNLDKKVTSALSKKGWEVTTAFTTCSGDATRLAREAVEQNYDAVLAAGGDGTVNETARALCDTGVALGIIPCGSGNGLARHLHIPVDIEAGIKVISRNHISHIDYGTINGRNFFCTCGMGFDASVSERFAAHSSRGLSTYLRSMLEIYRNYRPADYTITTPDGDTIKEHAFVVAVCNASQYGNNAYIAPDATIDDGMFDITIIRDAPVMRQLIAGLGMITGYINHSPIVRSIRVPAAHIEVSTPGPVHIDGEPTRLSAPFDFECQHHGLRVFTPVKPPRLRPIITPLASMMHETALRIRRIFRR